MHTNSIVGCHKNNLASSDVEDIKLPTILLKLLLYFKGFHTVINNYQCDFSLKKVLISDMRIQRFHGVNFIQCICIEYIESWTLSLMIGFLFLL